jgi:hypothetical protein
MRVDYWSEISKAQNVQFYEGALPAHVSVFGIVLGYDGLSVYPIGAFELCGKTAVYPPQTLNPMEEELFMGTAVGLTRAWDKTGVITLQFAKQRDGGDFALFDVREEIGNEAKHLLTMRGLWEGDGVSFLGSGGSAPELLELKSVGVSLGETLYTADSLRGALKMLPEAAQAVLSGWYGRILHYEG